MNAFEVLKQDHQELKNLFDAIGELDNAEELEELFNKMAIRLEMHADLEEAIFYPALEKHSPLKDMVVEALAEHEDIDALLDDIKDLDPENEEFESQLEILITSVEHHIAEEEQELFPKVLECIDATALENLGQQLELARGAGQSEAV